MRALYDAVDHADIVMVTAHAQDVYDDFRLLNQQARAELRALSIFGTLPEIDHLSADIGRAMVASWATLQALTQNYRLTSYDTGEIVEYRDFWGRQPPPPNEEEIVVQGVWDTSDV